MIKTQNEGKLVQHNSVSRDGIDKSSQYVIYSLQYTAYTVIT